MKKMLILMNALAVICFTSSVYAMKQQKENWPAILLAAEQKKRAVLNQALRKGAATTAFSLRAEEFVTSRFEIAAALSFAYCEATSLLFWTNSIRSNRCLCESVTQRINKSAATPFIFANFER